MLNRFRLIGRVVLMAVACCSASVSAQRMDRARAERLLRRPHAEGQFIVQFRAGTPEPEEIARYIRGGIRRLQPLGEGSFHLLEAEDGGQDVLLALSDHPEIDYVEPNYVIRVEKAPNDPMFEQQYGLNNTRTVGADIGATAAWDYATGGRQTVVAIIDTGVDHTHPDLSANIWQAPRPFAFRGANGTVTCPVGTTGVNAIHSTCVPMDDNGHGTHCAGIIGAAGNNGYGVAGVNWTASILPVKFLAANGAGLLSDALRAIDAVVQIKKQLGAEADIRVINASWGFVGNSQALDGAIAAANAADILFVTAAGNDGTNNDDRANFPANSTQPNVISVAATDASDGLASFSNFGSKVHLGAPGVSIASTYLNGRYVGMSGTSMATPMVAGAAALLLSACTADTAALRQHLLSTVDALPAFTEKTSTGGRLNVYKALRQCVAPRATMTATPAAQTVRAGESGVFSLLPEGVGGFTGSGTIILTGLPSGVSATIPDAVNLGTAERFTVSATGGATPGTYYLTATLTASGHKATTPLTLTIQAAPLFSLAFSAPPAAVKAGSTAGLLVKIGRVPGFSGAVTVTAQGLPSGVVMAPVTVPSGESTANLSLIVEATAAAGPFPLQLTATGGSPVSTAAASTAITIERVNALAMAFKSTQTSAKPGTTAVLEFTVAANLPLPTLQFVLGGLPSATTVQISPVIAGTYRLMIGIPTAWSGKSTLLKLNLKTGGMTATAMTTLDVDR